MSDGSMGGEDSARRGRGAKIGVGTVGIVAGLAAIARGLNAGTIDANGLWILGASMGGVALLLLLVLAGSLRAQKKQLAALVAKVVQQRPDAVVVPGVTEAAVIPFAPNRPMRPGHVALAVLPDRVEQWNRFSAEPSASVDRGPGGIRAEPRGVTVSNGRRTNVVDHLVCRDDEGELAIVPEYEVRRRADYPAGMERALRELGLPAPRV